MGSQRVIISGDDNRNAFHSCGERASAKAWRVPAPKVRLMER
jgi:hypothetical protein